MIVRQPCRFTIQAEEVAADFTAELGMAVRVRRLWQSQIGMDPQEVVYHLVNDPPTELLEEIGQYESVLRLEETLSDGEIKSLELIAEIKEADADTQAELVDVLCLFHLT